MNQIHLVDVKKKKKKKKLDWLEVQQEIMEVKSKPYILWKVSEYNFIQRLLRYFSLDQIWWTD